MSIIKSGEINGFMQAEGKKGVVVYIIKGIRMIKGVEKWEIEAAKSGQY